jgi:hypothetical protein
VSNRSRDVSRMRSLALLLLFGLTGYSCAQSAPVEGSVVLQVSIVSDQSEFRIGEAIPLQLAFSSAVQERYQINMAQYDRSGRMNYEHFKLFPTQRMPWIRWRTTKPVSEVG